MNESIFKKEDKSFHREYSFYENFRERLLTLIKSSFIQYLPSQSLKQLPPYYLYSFGSLLFCILIIIFVVLLVNGYTTERKQKFLAPLDREQPDKYCEEILVTNTGVYYASQLGYWGGDKGFLYSEATYIATATDFATDYESYNSFMTELYIDLVSAGNNTISYNLGYNLLYWFSWTQLPQGDASTRFSLIGDPVVVFNRPTIAASISSIHGVCNIPNTAYFDPGKAALIVQYDYSAYVNSSQCMSIIDPMYLGYVSGTGSNTFKINIDIRTLVTAMSINLGIADFSQLVLIESLSGYYEYDGILYNTSSYYDPKFAGMSPLTCLVSNNIKRCALKINEAIYALPIFNHLGNNTELPEPCDCSKMSSFEKRYAFSNCNLFNFLVGFIVWETFLPDAMMELLFRFDNNTFLTNEVAFNASFSASYWGQNSPFSSAFESTSYRTQAYDFCNNITSGSSSGLNCTIVTFSALAGFSPNWAISNYYYQLLNGACQDSISTSYEQWQSLISHPFAPLIQSYESCKTDPKLVLLTQLGSQVGNLSLFTPFAVAVIVLLLAIYSQIFRVQVTKTFSKEDKDAAIDALAISLLKARRLRQLKANQSVTKGADTDAESAKPTSLIDSLVELLEEEAELVDGLYFSDDPAPQTNLPDVNWNRLQKEILSPLGFGAVANKSEAHPHPPSSSADLSKAQLAMVSLHSSKLILNRNTTATTADIRSYSIESAEMVITELQKQDVLFKALNKSRLEGKDDNEDGHNFWVLVSKTGFLKSLHVLVSEDEHPMALGESQSAFHVWRKDCFRVIESILTLHACLSQGEMNVVNMQMKNGEKIAYFIGDKILTWQEIRSMSDLE